MDVLTLERAKPALPFAGSYQLLDFPLSNLVNSGIDDVWLSVQYQASAWRSRSATAGPGTSTGPTAVSGSWCRRRAPGRWTRRASQGQRRRALPVARRHPARRSRPGPGDECRPRLPPRLPGAWSTPIGARRPRPPWSSPTSRATYAEDPGDHGVVEVNRLGRVTDFAYKPEKPTSTTIATEVFALRARRARRGAGEAAPRALRRAGRG